MTTLAETIAGTDVRPGTVMAWWLSGTGFVLKTPAGTQLYIDPYFSNCVAQIFGIDRAVPPPVPVDAATPDLVIATHWHEDHLDPEALPQLAQRSPTRFLCPPTCRSRRRISFSRTITRRSSGWSIRWCSTSCSAAAQTNCGPIRSHREAQK